MFVKKIKPKLETFKIGPKIDFLELITEYFNKYNIYSLQIDSHFQYVKLM